VEFAERAPSDDWTALSLAGEEIAEAWFKPEGEASTLLVRVPRSRFETEDITQLLTLEDLLRAAAIPSACVDLWQVGEESHLGLGGANPELKRLLPPPSADATHLTIRIRLKGASGEGTEGDISPEQWQALEAKWKAILGVEASIEGLRHGLDSLRVEMESEFRKSLNVEHKVHALQADVANWTRAKSRVHYALPKAREFIHRAVWALGVPERKRLEEVHRAHIEPRIPFAGLDQVRVELDHLQKDRQVLASVGAAVSQECRGILSEIRQSLSTLQRNAVENSRRKRSSAKEKGKHF
jgi:hypothetical protein